MKMWYGMSRNLFVGILALSLLATTVVRPSRAFALTQANQSVTSSPKRHLTTIVFAGLAGAVLGLSTLSFYGRPQDRLSNIPVGFAIGVISGTLYTTYTAAAKPKEFYGDYEPELWQLETEPGRLETAQTSPRATFTFEF